MVKGVVIGDIHFGIKDSKRLYDELSLFKNYISEKNDIDIIVFNGDFFDRKISIGDPECFYAVSFFSEVIKIVKNSTRRIKVRMIQGTKSHDLNQLQLFKPYEGDLDLDFRIIETVTTENMLGLDVLYLPEEYPENSEDYYRDYKTGKYNIILGHGTWDFVAQPGVLEHSKLSTHSAPVFMWNEWKESVENGFIVFGHIHGRNTYGKKIFYPGSFSRWNFGERSEKGFVYFEYDTDNKTYSVEYINNTLAPKYDVVAVKDLNIDLETVSIDILKEAIDAVVDSTDNLRVDISGLSTENAEIIKKYYQQKQNVKVEDRDRKSQLRESSIEADPEIAERIKKYQYITKRQLPIAETIQRFCKEDLSTEISLDVIGGIISDGKEVS